MHIEDIINQYPEELREQINLFARMSFGDDNSILEGIEEIVSEDLEKGRKAQIGEIRERGGRKWKKISEGKWVPVPKGKQGVEEEEEPESKTGSKQEQEPKTYTDDELATYARTATTSQLKEKANGNDEKLRIAAKNELHRREQEEDPKNRGENQEEQEKGTSETEEETKQTPKQNIESELESLNNLYKSVTQQLLEYDWSDAKEGNRLSSEQKRISHYIQNINGIKNADATTKKGYDTMMKHFGLKSPKEVQDFFGDGKILSMHIEKMGSVIHAETLTQDGYFERIISSRSKRVEMSLFLLNPSIKRGAGVGVDIFVNQIKSFKKQGFETLDTLATMADGFNGAITWAKLGYEMNDQSLKSILPEIIADSDNKQIQKCKTLGELMSFDDGRNYWVENAASFPAVFDIRDGSDNMNRLNKYLESKGKETIGSN